MLRAVRVSGKFLEAIELHRGTADPTARSLDDSKTECRGAQRTFSENTANKRNEMTKKSAEAANSPPPKLGRALVCMFRNLESSEIDRGKM
jgi:hypothetical protein